MQGESYLRNLSTIFSSITNAMEEKMMPWNFKYGLCGIGWGLIYLYSYKFVGSEITDILRLIDSEIETINIEAVSDYSLATGISGILAYAAVRQIYQEKLGLTPLRISSLHKIAKRILRTFTAPRACYYSLLFLEYHPSSSIEPTRMDIGEWSDAPLFLPIDSHYWDISLEKGCAGAMIKALNWEEIRKLK